MYATVPVVKIAYNARPDRIRSPERKARSLDAVYLAYMGSQNFIDLVVDPLLDLFNILISYNRSEAIGIIDLLCPAVLIGYLEAIIVFLLFILLDEYRVKASLVHKLHRILVDCPGNLDDNGNLLYIRKKCLDKNPVLYVMPTEQLMWLVLFRVDHSLDFRPIHHLIQLLIHFISFFK